MKKLFLPLLFVPLLLVGCAKSPTVVSVPGQPTKLSTAISDLGNLGCTVVDSNVSSPGAVAFFAPNGQCDKDVAQIVAAAQAGSTKGTVLALVAALSADINEIPGLTQKEANNAQYLLQLSQILIDLL